MSDADWDIEYALASELYDELEALCKERNIPVPDTGEYPRSWELKEMISKLKEE